MSAMPTHVTLVAQPQALPLPWRAGVVRVARLAMLLGLVLFVPGEAERICASIDSRE